MKKYQKYIIVPYIKNYLRVSILLSCIMLMIQSVNLLDDISHKATIGFGAMAPMMGLIFLNVLYVSSLISSVIAAIISIFSISSSSEIIILKNAGIKNSQILQPIFLITACITFAMYIFSFFIIPYSFASMQSRIDGIYHKHMSNIIKPNKLVQFENNAVYIKPIDQNYASIFLASHTDGVQYLYVPRGKFWVTNSMIGISGANAVMESISHGKHSYVTFKIFESQIDLINQSKKTNTNDSLKVKNIIILVNEFFNTKDRKPYFEEINIRLSIPLLNIILPLLVYSFFLKFYSTRARIGVLKIGIFILCIAYIIGSYHMFPMLFHTQKSVHFIYINILLTFLFAYLISKDFYKRNA